MAMDQDFKKLLEDNLALNKANNEMLLILVHAQKMQKLYRIFYWAVIIIVTIASFYFIEPYLGSMINLYSGGAGNMSDVSKTLGDQQQLQELLKSLNQ